MSIMGVISDKLQNSIKDIGRKSNLTEQDIKDTIKEIRFTLLEADVNYQVAKTFCKNIEEKALGADILKGLRPDEQMFKIIKDEMIDLLEGNNELNLSSPNLILMVGLQGSGKTTTSAKLALRLRKKGYNKPLLVACDVYRPAAIDQLITLGKQIQVDVYSEKDNKDVNQIASNAINFAKENNHDLIILDTAGRMHVDTELMDEIKLLQTNFSPSETILVLDGTVGQQASEVADNFKEYVNVSGLVFTKMDGDTRGGGVLSVKKTTGVDIKFLGTSEKLDGLEEFVPDRVVGRILGQGDMLGLIEKAEELDTEENRQMAEKMLEGKFDLNDFLKQIEMMNKMGGLSSIMKMLPGANKIDMSKFDENEIIRTKAIIQSMTDKERSKPALLNATRRQRIANGSGTKVQDVNKMIKGYENSKKMMKQMKNMDMSKMMDMIK